MRSPLQLVLAATSAPVAVNPNDITPGVVGFLAILFVTAVTVLLILDMNRRIRRTRYRAQLDEQRARTEHPGQ